MHAAPLLCLTLSGLASLGLPSSAQSAQELASSFELPEGLEVSLWAESPMLYNPTAFDVDARGRIWVTEAVNYRKWDGRNPGREHPGGDRVLILEDTDGDGRADSSKVFVQEPELVAPLGICVLGNSVYVSCSPDIIRYTDLDGDDLPDRREVFLTGFGGHDHDHGVHSLVAGADGFLYGVVGNAGPHLVTDADGWSLRSGSIYRSGGAQASDNKPGLLSDDGRLWTGGLIFRVRPSERGATDLQVLAHNFRNPYEVALDSYGNLFTADNDDDGNASCRTLWVMEGANYGFFSADGSRTWQADQRPGQDKPSAHWRREDPGVASTQTINGAGAPTGVAVYEGQLLAPWIDGAVLNCDAGRGLVYAHRPRERGASIELDPGVLIEAKPGPDGPRAFRPSDVVVGVDGAVYVADWYDPGVGGHQAQDREAYGRILRIAPRQAPGRIEPGGLASPAIQVRAEQLWSTRSADLEALPVLEQPRLAARLLQSPACSEALQRQVLERRELHPWLRSAAFRGLTPTEELLQQLVDDGSPTLRRLVASYLGLQGHVKEELLLSLVKHLVAGDATELEALGLAFRGHEQALWPRLAGAQADAPLEWSRRLADLAWRLHPPQALEGLLTRARAPSLDLEQRRRAMDALAFMQDPAAASAMADLALRGPQDLREMASWWSSQRATNLWRAYARGVRNSAGDMGAAELLYQSPVLRQGSVEIDLDVEGGRVLWLVATDGGNGNACDWADWLEPRLTVQAEPGGPGGPGEHSTLEARPELLPLRNLTWSHADAQWGAVHWDKNASGGPLMVEGVPVRGIGTHANSRIAFELPPGSRRFQVRAALDDGGTSQGMQATSVRFEVHLERGSPHERVQELAACLQDATRSAEEHEEALLELAQDAEGGMLLLHLADQDLLGADLLGLVAESIFQNPDLSVRALASQRFQRSGSSRKLPSIAELLELPGDPTRGQQLFFGDRASCAKCHAMLRGDARRGLDIGPELTEIRNKYSREQLLDAILNPSAGIAFGYETWIVETRAGRLYSGFLLADGPTLVIKDTQGERHVVEAKEVERRWKQEVSTMPDGLSEGLEPRGLMDIVAFLQEDPEREPRFGEPIVLFDGQDLDAWTHHLADPSVPMEAVWSIEDGELICEGNPVGYLRTKADFTNFELSLEWRFDPSRGPGNSGVLLRMVGPDKVWPKSIEAQLQHRNAGDIWNIDGFDMDCAPERTSGRHTGRRLPSSELPLGEWNRYVITLDGEELRLEVNGQLQNTARWCEELAGKICLQSEGAAIRFRNIQLRPILH